MGPGSLFGEKSLLGRAPRLSSVRARTAVKVLVMGTTVFTQSSPSLAVLRDALARTLNGHATEQTQGQEHNEAA
jgi:CRP-like cAMP-binding protein